MGVCVPLEKVPGDSDTQPLTILLPLKITPHHIDLHCLHSSQCGILWISLYFGSIHVDIFFSRICVPGEKYAFLLFRNSHFSWKDDFLLKNNSNRSCHRGRNAVERLQSSFLKIRDGQHFSFLHFRLRTEQNPIYGNNLLI